MDAGTAAVLGALAGSVATIGAALATGWAQREGARITARSEHRRERREPRHDVYKEFISALTAMRFMASVFAIDAEHAPDNIDDELMGRWLEVVNRIGPKAIETTLAGPKDVAKAAIRLHQLGDDIYIRLKYLERLLASNEANDQAIRVMVRRLLFEEAKQFQRRADDFIFTAQAALDDDGSRK
ncbi:hypothetical protein [Streptomyces sp. NPDC005131]